MKLWNSDEELVALVHHELFSAVVGDVMDKLGLFHQFLSPQIQPLRPDMVVFGRAMTVLEADIPGDPSGADEGEAARQPFGLMFKALDDLKPGEVYFCTGASPHYALWGELMTTRARVLKAAGAVLDGYSRDTRGILGLNFPTFSYGSYAQDQGPRGRVVDFRVPVEIGPVRIHPGDWVLGDVDGVCIIPQVAQEEVFSRALEKARGEKLVQKAIQAGMSTVEAFAKFKIM